MKTEKVIGLIDEILKVCNGENGSVTIIALLEALAHVMAKTVHPNVSNDVIIAQAMDQLREAITDLREGVESEESVH